MFLYCEKFEFKVKERHYKVDEKWVFYLFHLMYKKFRDPCLDFLLYNGDGYTPVHVGTHALFREIVGTCHHVSP